jgi:hypothetical protein
MASPQVTSPGLANDVEAVNQYAAVIEAEYRDDLCNSPLAKTAIATRAGVKIYYFHHTRNTVDIHERMWEIIRHETR